MIDGIFWAMMNCIGSILKFVIVFLILGFVLFLPFLLKGGWMLGILIFGFFGIWIWSFLMEQSRISKEEFEKKMKEREEQIWK